MVLRFYTFELPIGHKKDLECNMILQDITPFYM